MAEGFSLLLGLERLLAEETPKLRDGAELNAHQVDALSGTLAELMAEQQTIATEINGNGHANGSGNGAAATLPAEEGEEDLEANGAVVLEPDEVGLEEEEPLDWDDEPEPEDEAAARITRRGPRRRAGASGLSMPPAPARPSPPSASSTPRRPVAF